MARTIDGFMPRTTTAPRVSARTVEAHHRMNIMPAVRPAPVVPAPIAPIQPLIPRRIYATPARAEKRRRGIPERLQLPLIIIGAMLAGIFAQSAVFGEGMVVLYGIAALWWRVASRTTFTLALVSMVATTLLLVVRGNVALAQNFATYTFLLLVVGVITLIRELKKEGGRIYNNRKNIS